MPSRRTISRQSLPEAIAQDLRARILSGELKEGAPIRQEALAEEYEVSRMPVRDALQRLHAEGLVHLSNNRGAFVAKHSLSEIEEIFDLRLMLEVDLFRRAIPAMTRTEFARCEALLNDLEVSFDADDVSRWGELNYQYHMTLYSAAGRSLTNDILQRVNLLSDRYVRMHLSVMKQREPAKVEHEQMLALAKAGENDKACDVLRRHILRTKKQLVEMVSANRGSENPNSSR